MSEAVKVDRMPLDELLVKWRPGSFDPPWTWDDEERDLLSRVCCCCGVEGHYQRALEEHLSEVGSIEQPVCLGYDGRVWDGHHRIVAARRLGFESIPIEPDEE